jgi:N-acetylneuraminate synthase/sialic acid synthase
MARELIIEGRRIDDSADCYVVAEIGHNHQGSVERCLELFRLAHECGADAVKLQKRDNRNLYTRAAYDAPYASESAFGATYGEHRSALEFGLAEYRELQAYAREIGIAFFATAFDIASADFLAELEVPAFKIASGDLTNWPLLRHVASFRKPILVSTGGGTLEDVERAYEAIAPFHEQICFLQATAGYPPAWEELNLKVIETFRDRFADLVIGLSAHDSGIAMALVGYVLGARVIEKHVTLNRALKGTDHAFSLERSGLQKLVRDLRRARLALGDGVKQRYPSEEMPLHKMGKKLVAARDLEEGHVLTAADVAIKSPGDGLPPLHLDDILGQVTLRSLARDENISFADLAARVRRRAATVGAALWLSSLHLEALVG